MKKITSLFLSILICATYSKGKNDTVSILNNSFIPNVVNIEVGDTITFINTTNSNHNVNGTQSIFPSNQLSFGNSVDF